MKPHRNRRVLKISTRVWLLSSMFTALVLFVGGYGQLNTQKLTHALHNISTHHLKVTSDLILIDMYHDGLAALVYKGLEYTTEQNFAGLNEVKKDAEEMSGNAKSKLASLRNMEHSKKAQQEIEAATNDMNNYVIIAQAVIGKAANMERDAALARLSEFEAAFAKLESSLGQLGDDLSAETNLFIEEAQDSSNTAMIVNSVILIVGIMLGLVIAWFFVRDIYLALSRVSEDLANGSEKLIVSSSHLGSSSGNLAELTTEQSSAIEETVSSMEEMSAMISQTTQNAGTSQDEAHQALATISKGKEVVGMMVNSMTDIARSNDKLQSIVKVIEDINNRTKIINDIAFETKLLAFNASIEAARAGAHGRGFSVVAEEVGKLANVSGEAADEVRNLLESSLSDVKEIVADTRSKVDQGQGISRECEQSFLTIEKVIQGMSSGIEKIAQATKEQEIGVRQTNHAMTEMEKLTQSNSRHANKLADYAANLKLIANGMQASSNHMADLVWGANRQDSDTEHQAGDHPGGAGGYRSGQIERSYKGQHGSENGNQLSGDSLDSGSGAPKRTDSRWRQVS